MWCAFYSLEAYQLLVYTFFFLMKAIMGFNLEHWNLFATKFNTIAIETLRNLTMGVSMLIAIFMRHTLNAICAKLDVKPTNMGAHMCDCPWLSGKSIQMLNISTLDCTFFKIKTTSSRIYVYTLVELCLISYIIPDTMAHCQTIFVLYFSHWFWRLNLNTMFWIG